jgi:hypothetical protein
MFGAVNIVDYGAHPDAHGDVNAAAIAAAATQAGATRATVYVPSAPGKSWNLGDNRIDLKTVHLTGTWIPSGSDTGAVVRFAGQGGFHTTWQNGDGFSVSNLAIVGSGGDTPTANGQILVDFTGVGKPRLHNVRLQRAGTGVLLRNGSVVECNYGMFTNVDPQRCWVGFDVQGNSHTWIAGRPWLNRTAVHIPQAGSGWWTNINFHGTAFEGNSNAAVDSTGSNVAFFGCRFENPNVVEGSVTLRPNAQIHYFHGNHWSSGVHVLDQTPGGSAYGTDLAANSSIMSPAPGPNLARNPGFKVDSTGDGVADGWALTFSSLGVHTAVIDPVKKLSGVASQQVQNIDTRNLRLYQAIPTEPGVRYVVRARVWNEVGSLQMRCGVTPGGTEYANQLVGNGEWRTMTAGFRATGDTMHLSFYLNGVTPTTFWVDSVTATAGLTAPAHWVSPGD